MKHLLSIITLIITAQVTIAQDFKYNTPYQESVNLEPSRSKFISLRKTSGTKGSPIDTTLSFKELNIKWAYKIIDDIQNVPDSSLQNFLRKTEDLSSWIDSINPIVNTFQYTTLPVMEQKPEKPEQINTLLVAGEIFIPYEFIDKAIYLNIGATNGKTTLYINGQEVGFKTDSKLNAEFNISQYVERGKNRIVLQTDDWSMANYIESNAGANIINPKIYIFAQPKIRIFDVITKTSFDPTYRNGLLEIALLIKTELLNPHKITVYYDLFSPFGTLINQEYKEIEIDMRNQDTVRFTASITDVDKWNHINPALYTVQFTIKRDGHFTEYLWSKIGFRSVESKDNQIIVNGLPVYFKGVNADAIASLTDPETTNKQLNKDLSLLKYAGFNAIRTPYPLQPELYDICDSLGIYVIENVNINSRHSSKSIYKGGTLANNPAWKDIFVFRATNTYQRGKSNPSIIAWGLGEQAGNGYNMYQAYNAIRAIDETRAIVYDDAQQEWNSDVFMPIIPNKKNTRQKITLEDIAKYKITPSRIQLKSNVFDSIQSGFITLPYGETITAKELINTIKTNINSITIKPIELTKGTLEVYNNTDVDIQNIPLKYIIKKGSKIVEQNTIIINIIAKNRTTIQIPKVSKKSSVTITVGTLATFSK